MSDVTSILSQLDADDPHAAEKLLPLVYKELRKLAAAKLTQEKPGQTLQATALVHEAYLRLVDGKPDQQWKSRGHFFGAAAEAMRRILVDRARRELGQKQGGEFRRADADLDRLSAAEDSGDVLAIDEALSWLAKESPMLAKLVELRYFAGLSQDDAAVALELSPRTARRNWTHAKAWLLHKVRGDPA